RGHDPDVEPASLAGNEELLYSTRGCISEAQEALEMGAAPQAAWAMFVLHDLLVWRELGKRFSEWSEELGEARSAFGRAGANARAKNHKATADELIAAARNRRAYLEKNGISANASSVAREFIEQKKTDLAFNRLRQLIAPAFR